MFSQPLRPVVVKSATSTSSGVKRNLTQSPTTSKPHTLAKLFNLPKPLSSLNGAELFLVRVT